MSHMEHASRVQGTQRALWLRGRMPLHSRCTIRAHRLCHARPQCAGSVNQMTKSCIDREPCASRGTKEKTGPVYCTAMPSLCRPRHGRRLLAKPKRCCNCCLMYRHGVSLVANSAQAAAREASTGEIAVGDSWGAAAAMFLGHGGPKAASAATVGWAQVVQCFLCLFSAVPRCKVVFSQLYLCASTVHQRCSFTALPRCEPAVSHTGRCVPILVRRFSRAQRTPSSSCGCRP